MTLESAILQNIEKLPNSVKNAVLLYTDFLVSQYHQDNLQEIVEPIERPRLAGSLNGMFTLPLPDDFDEPLEELEEYLQ